MIDAAIQIRPGMRFDGASWLAGKEPFVVDMVEPDGTVWSTRGTWIDEAKLRRDCVLLDPPAPSEPARPASCKFWCGMEYGDGRVPNMVGAHEFLADKTMYQDAPDRIGGLRLDQPAYCSQACLDAAKQPERKPERKVERRLAAGWTREDFGVVTCDCDVPAKFVKWMSRGKDLLACLACAESMGVYESLAAAENEPPRHARTSAPSVPKVVMEGATPAAATYSCPCARMNLRDLSGDPVCYCTERPKPVRVVGRYALGEGPGRFGRVPIAEFDGYCAWFGKQTGVATGLAMEARPKTLTEIACERGAKRYGSTSDKWPSGA